MARVDRDGKVGTSPQYRDRAHVEGVAGGGFERANAALAEDHLGVAGLLDVARRLQPLVVCGRHASLDDDGQPAPSRRAEEGRVVHGARADHQCVDMTLQERDVVDLEGLCDHGKTGCGAGSVEEG